MPALSQIQKQQRKQVKVQTVETSTKIDLQLEQNIKLAQSLSFNHSVRKIINILMKANFLRWHIEANESSILTATYAIIRVEVYREAQVTLLYWKDHYYEIEIHNVNPEWFVDKKRFELVHPDMIVVNKKFMIMPTQKRTWASMTKLYEKCVKNSFIVPPKEEQVLV